MLLTSSLLAASTALAPGLVARVADQPIYKTDFDHWFVVAEKSTGGGDREQTTAQVMQLLISFQWLDQESKRLGVTVSDGAVDTAFRRQKQQSFPTEKDFQEFLATSGQTIEDFKRRVRLDLLSNKLRDRAVGDAKTPEGQQRRLTRYVRRFSNRWRRQTACGTGYYIQDSCVKEVPLSA